MRVRFEGQGLQFSRPQQTAHTQAPEPCISTYSSESSSCNSPADLHLDALGAKNDNCPRDPSHKALLIWMRSIANCAMAGSLPARGVGCGGCAFTVVDAIGSTVEWRQPADLQGAKLGHTPPPPSPSDPPPPHPRVVDIPSQPSFKGQVKLRSCQAP